MARNIINEVNAFLRKREQVKASGGRPPPPIKFPFTQARLRDLPAASAAYVVLDENQAGLQCRVLPSGAMTLQVHRRPAGSHRMVRIKISTVADQLPVDGKDGVRARARTIIGELEQGIDPNEQARTKKAQEAAEHITLQQALDSYIDDVKLAPSTVAAYRSRVNGHLADWMNLPLCQVTADMVAARYKRIGAKTPAAATNVTRVIRLLFEFCELDWNPIRRKMKKRWHRGQRRTRYIPPTSLKAWWQATEALAASDYPRGELWRDYLQFLIMTGLRRREGSDKLLWENIDLRAKVLIVHNTKNHRDHTLPLSDYLVDILTRRRAADPKAETPFPITDTKRPVDWIINNSGVAFCPHDLRRSFLTYAELQDYGMMTIKKLANHSGGDDVTAGYIQVSVERLREPMQKISDLVLKAAGVKESAAVIILAGKRSV